MPRPELGAGRSPWISVKGYKGMLFLQDTLQAGKSPERGAEKPALCRLLRAAPRCQPPWLPAPGCVGFLQNYYLSPGCGCPAPCYSQHRGTQRWGCWSAGPRDARDRGQGTARGLEAKLRDVGCIISSDQEPHFHRSGWDDSKPGVGRAGGSVLETRSLESGCAAPAPPAPLRSPPASSAANPFSEVPQAFVTTAALPPKTEGGMGGLLPFQRAEPRGIPCPWGRSPSLLQPLPTLEPPLHFPPPNFVSVTIAGVFVKPCFTQATALAVVGLWHDLSPIRSFIRGALSAAGREGDGTGSPHPKGSGGGNKANSSCCPLNAAVFCTITQGQGLCLASRGAQGMSRLVQSLQSPAHLWGGNVPGAPPVCRVEVSAWHPQGTPCVSPSSLLLPPALRQNSPK